MSDRKRIVEAEVIRKPDNAGTDSRSRFGARWAVRSQVMHSDPQQAAILIKRARLRFGGAALVFIAIAVLLGWSAATTEHVLLAAFLLIGTAATGLIGLFFVVLWRLLGRASQRMNQ